MKQEPSASRSDVIDARLEWVRLAARKGLPMPSRDELAAFHDGYKAALADVVSEQGALYEAASDAATLLADMQPTPTSNQAKVLAKLDRALKPFERPAERKD